MDDGVKVIKEVLADKEKYGINNPEVREIRVRVGVGVRVGVRVRVKVIKEGMG